MKKKKILFTGISILVIVSIFIFMSNVSFGLTNNGELSVDINSTNTLTYLDVIVSFNSMGGSEISSSRYNDNNFIELPRPTKSGYRFKGWSALKDGSEIIEDSIKGINSASTISGISCAQSVGIECDYANYVELYAVWTDTTCNVSVSDEFKVNFYTNGGKIDNNTAYNTIDATNLGNYSINFCNLCNVKYPSVYRSGYTFDGWYYNKGLTIKTTDDLKNITKLDKYDSKGCKIGYKNRNLYAKWTTESSSCLYDNGTYPIIFKTNGGNAIDSIDFNYKSQNIDFSLPTPVRSGYVFKGWSLLVDYSNNGIYSSKIENLIYKNPNWYNIYESSNHMVYSDSYTGEKCIYAPLTVYAVWEKVTSSSGCSISTNNNIKLTYKTNGGNTISNTYVCVNCVAESYLSLAIPKKSGYTFDGWYSDEKLTKKIESNNTKEIVKLASAIYDSNNCITGYKDVTIYAKWLKNEDPITINKCPKINNFYSLIFFTTGGNTINNLYPCVDCSADTAQLIPYPVREGYVFDGWYYDSNFANEVVSSTISSLNTKVTKTYDKNGCVSGYNSIRLYAKWVNESDSCVSTLTSDKTFKISYVLSNEEIIEKPVCYNCNNYENLLVPQRTGYTFAGWYYDIDYTKEVSLKNTEDVKKISEKRYTKNGCLEKISDISLYAKWIKTGVICKELDEAKLAIDYQLNGGKLLFVNENSGLPLAIKDKYTFNGWYYDEKLRNPVSGTGIVDVYNNASRIYDDDGCAVDFKNIKLYAKWLSTKKTTIKGKLVSKDGTVLVNYIIEMHSDPIKTMSDENGYYEFDGVSEGDHTIIVKDPDENIVGMKTVTVAYETKTNIENSVVGYEDNNSNIEMNIQLMSGELNLDVKENKTNWIAYISGIAVVVLIAGVIIFTSKSKKNRQLK